MLFFALGFIVLFVIAAFVYLFIAREYRIDSPRINRMLRAWAAPHGAQAQERKGEEGKVVGFSVDRGRESFTCEYVASFEKKIEPPRLVLSVACQLPGELEIFREKPINRLSKKIGLDREIQTWEEYFDREFYLQTEAPAFYRALFSHRETRCLVSELLGTRDSGRKLVLKEGRIQLIVAPITPWRMARLKVDRVVELLASLAEAIVFQSTGSKEAFSESFRKAPDAVVKKRLKASNFIYPLLLSAGGLFLNIAGRANVYSVDNGFLGLVVLVALALTALLAFFGYLAFRGTAYSRKLLLGMLSTYLMANFFFSSGAILYFNCQLDRGRAELLLATVVEKNSRSGKNFRTHYNLVVILDGERDERGLSVSKEMYDRYKRDSRLLVSRKAGRLGISWINEVRSPRI
jgi:hypothetical protein